ncbi:MAG: glycosyltransferase family 1 protein [Synoicihabitans sp.]
MKLTIVSETFPPEVNGVAMTFGIIATELGRLGHDVTIYRPDRDDLPDPAAEPHYRQVGLPGLSIPGYNLLRLGWPAKGRLKRDWRQSRPDLVHVVTEGPLGASAVIAAQDLGIPVTSSFHTNFHAYTSDYGFAVLNRLVLWWLRFVHNRTQRTFAPTDELCAELAAMGFRNTSLLSRGIDTVCFSPERRNEKLRAEWGAGPSDRVVLHVGRMAPEKNYDLLFRIYDAMRMADPSLKFVLAGDGPIKEKLVAEHPECTFAGFFSRQDIGEYYASADIYVHASLTETFGNVLTEAMASGLAVAGFDYAAAKQFVTHEQNGLLAPGGEETALLEESVRLASDPKLADRLRQAARKGFELQSWDRVIGRFEADLLREAGLVSDP